MRYLLALPFLLFAAPALASVPPHSGVIHTRSMPELSDIALFGMAVAGVWLARRALGAGLNTAVIPAKNASV